MMPAHWRTLAELQHASFARPLLELLHTPCPEHKLKLARQALQNLSEALGEAEHASAKPETASSRQEAIEQKNSRAPFPWDLVAMPALWSTLPTVPARPSHFTVATPHTMPKRRSPRDPRGAASLIHALAQIELAAIEIDSASLLLYPLAPPGWQLDMLRIIRDECDHFEALGQLLVHWQSPFGTWPIHHALWQGFLAGKSWLEHLALTTRYQEANGVDASKELLERTADAPAGQRLGDARPLLEKLHQDEIRHVALGSKWWHFAFDWGGVWPSLRARDEAACERYFAIIESRVPNPWSRRFPFYLEGRRRAGFTPDELAVFGKLQENRLAGVAKPSRAKRQELLCSLDSRQRAEAPVAESSGSR